MHVDQAHPHPVAVSPRKIGQSIAEMPLRRVRSSAGYLAIWLHPSSRWAIEITRASVHLSLGTFKTPALAACAYDAMVWQHDGPRGAVKSPAVGTHVETDFLGHRFRLCASRRSGRCGASRCAS
jgi:hypothetical protein